jgi:membrane fusion protein (multidrug efflux system)
MRPHSTVAEPRRSTTLRMIVMLLIAGAIFGGVFLVKSMMNQGMNDYFDNMTQPPVTVTAAEARMESWRDTIEAVGTLIAVNGTHVTTEVGGVVSAIRFESGQEVNAGDVLLQLNTSTEAAALRSLEASLKLAQTQRARYRELYEGGRLVAKSDLDERESEAERMEAEVNAQRALIAKKTIRAPFAGRLGIRQINLGQYLNPGDPIVSLQSLDPIYLNFTLPEQRLNNVQIGQAVTASADSLPEESFAGTITAVESEVDASTRNFTVQATMQNPQQRLRPGSFARVRLDLGHEQDRIVVPQTAISFNPYGNSVWVITQAGDDAQAGADGESPLVVKQRFVETGATRGDLIAIHEGLITGERVVSSGLLKLRPDAVVIVDNTVQPASDEKPEVENR